MSQILSSSAKNTIEEVINSDTQVSSLGYPFISDSSFQIFLKGVPHLFTYGQTVLEHLDKMELQNESQERARKVLKQVVLTAAITAPSDLWLLKHLITIHRKLGILPRLVEGPVDIEEHCKKHGFNKDLLDLDLRFMESRGLLEMSQENVFFAKDSKFVAELLTDLTPYPSKIPVDIVEVVKSYIGDPKGAAKHALEDVFLPQTPKHEPTDWRPGIREVEVGAALVPVVLAMALISKQSEKRIQNIVPTLPFEVFNVLKMAGIVQEGGILTQMGNRVLERAPGPFGIIHAYHTYLNQQELKLKGEPTKTWVQRGANVAASQAANAKTFLKANDALDQFVSDTGYEYSAFLEHAVGQGEATRQRFERNGDSIRYFGADLEDAAIDRAVAEQEKGILPGNMKFLRNADIGKPEMVRDFLDKEGVLGQNVVMMVGNGFHEIRDQNDEKMKQVFEGYRKANILLIFTEESALSTEDLITTGFNTYHAGFRYVHELSGQGLRPDITNPDTRRLSWPQCIEAGGYQLVEKYTKHGRTIYPHPRPDGKNPAISVTYFCVPKV